LLSEDERRKTLEAERAENLKVCLTGRYLSLCDRSLLSAEQDSQVSAAEQRAKESVPQKQRTAESSTRARRYGTSSCETGHWIESVLDDGQMIKLEDGSIWQVDPVDAIDSALWLPVTDVIVCTDKIINVDDNESVSAMRIR